MRPRGVTREFRTSGSFKGIIALMGLVVIVGAAGFFATGLSALGFLKFPASFQWPAGYVKRRGEDAKWKIRCSACASWPGPKYMLAVAFLAWVARRRLLGVILELHPRQAGQSK